MLNNKKEIPNLPKGLDNYKKFLKEASKKKCDCKSCEMFKVMLKDFSKEELEECLRTFLIECSYEIPKYPSYLG